MDNALSPDLPIYLIDDDEGVLRAVERTLRLNGYNHLVALGDSRMVVDCLRGQPAALVLLDITMPHLSGDRLLEDIVAEFPGLPVIMATATDSVEMVVDCMKKGAFDYISKPLSTARLLVAINGALQMRDLRRENAALREKDQDKKPSNPKYFQDSLTANREMLKIFHYIEGVSPSSQPVLITGETGVGKELAARAVHRASGRKGLFVAVNAAGLDDEVFADTLFGHVKGAYTGAVAARDGQIRKASGGTLFLDEIGDLSLKSQVKLLRLLQEKEFFPLGADSPIKTDARIIVATNKNMEQMVEEARFRKDLYFRLYAHHVALPPLRRRFDDLPLLVSAFVDEAAREFGGTKPAVSRELYPLLENYTFPGNIRELKSMVFDAVSRGYGTTLGLDPFMQSTGLTAARDTLRQTGQAPGVSFGPHLPTMKEARHLLAVEALRRSHGNISLAARLIGLTRQSLSQFIHSHDILLPAKSNRKKSK